MKFLILVFLIIKNGIINIIIGIIKLKIGDAKLYIVNNL